MTYKETVDYLFSQLPMFQRIGAAAYKADLSNTIALCELLGNPQHKFKSIHVAGTNGKGSVSSALASILQEAGFKTGLFTSPHLKDYRERIRLNGALVPEEAVMDFVATYKDRVREIQPSFFEMTCALAFDFFAKAEVDIAVLEVGMGGRLDSTNLVIPEISVITSVSMDHQQFLGDTLDLIAREKGGIIKHKVPVVFSENPLVVMNVLCEIAAKVQAPFYSVTAEDPGLETDLGGIYQFENMRTVRKTVEILRLGGWTIPEEAMAKGTMNVVKNTGLRGRWEILSDHPLTIADVGHNEEGVALAMDMLLKIPAKKVHIVWGMMSDKDAGKIFDLLPKHAFYYWCRPDVPRGKDVAQLKNEGAVAGLLGESYPTVTAAAQAAQNAAGPDDVVFFGGSVFVVAEVL